MKKNGISLILLISLFLLLFTACGGGNGSDSEVENGGSPTYTLRFACQAAPDYPTTIAAQRAADEIFERTHGDVLLKVYPTSQLGDYVSVYEEVMRGTIDIANISMPSQFNELMEMNWIPYLTTDYSQLGDVYLPGSNYWEIYSGLQEELGLTLLSITMDGYMGIGAAKIKDLNGVGDFTIKKAELIRIPGSDIIKTLALDMGYNTTSIPYSDLYPALQTGVADGWMGGNSYIQATAFIDVIDYFIDYRYIMENIGTIINTDILQSLPEEYQGIIREVFLEEAVNSFDEIEAIDKEGIRLLKEAGITIIEFTQEERDGMANYIKETTWPKLEDKFGADIMERILDDVSIER